MKKLIRPLIGLGIIVAPIAYVIAVGGTSFGHYALILMGLGFGLSVATKGGYE